jgi:hypothetical protein
MPCSRVLPFAHDNVKKHLSKRRHVAVRIEVSIELNHNHAQFLHTLKYECKSGVLTSRSSAVFYSYAERHNFLLRVKSTTLSLSARYPCVTKLELSVCSRETFHLRPTQTDFFHQEMIAFSSSLVHYY